MFGVQKIFKQDATCQGPILGLVYPWYTNMEHNGKKDEISSFTHTRHLTFYIHNMYASSNTRKKCTKVSHGKIIHISFHKQTVCGRGIKCKKGLWWIAGSSPSSLLGWINMKTSSCVHTFLYFWLKFGHFLHYLPCKQMLTLWNIDGKYNSIIFTGLWVSAESNKLTRKLKSNSNSLSHDFKIFHEVQAFIWPQKLSFNNQAQLTLARHNNHALTTMV